ncbi:MAG: VWA domain-containing protein [Flavobacteriales bacterium]|nr:VWA domain-containing protein [Flavobacteriales bacterium]
MKKILFVLVFTTSFFDVNYGQNQDFWNDLTSKINEKVDFYNAVGESVMEYNKRIYQHYIKRDSISYKPFSLKNTYGTIYLNPRKIRRENRRIRKHIADNNQPEIALLVRQIFEYEKGILHEISTFSMNREFNFKYNLERTNEKFQKINELFSSLETNLFFVNEIISKNKNYSEQSKSIKELIEVASLTAQARDSLRYGTIASMHSISEKFIPQNYQEINERSFDSTRIYDYKRSIDKYYSRRNLSSLDYFTSPYYFSNEYIDSKVKIQHRFYNHLVHLVSTNKYSSKSFIDSYNKKIKTSENYSLLQKPLILIDPLKLTRNNGFGANRIIMPKSFTLILLDVSGSMDKQNRLSRCKEAIEKLIEDKEDKEYFSVIIFSQFSKLLFKPEETDKDFQRNQIRQIKTFGETNAELGIKEATELLKQYTTSRKNNKVILITDGNFDITDKMNAYMYQIKAKRSNFSIIILNDNSEMKQNLNQLTDINDGKVQIVDKNQSIYELLKEEIDRESEPKINN